MTIPVEPGYVMMAFPPNGQTMVKPVWERGEVVSYMRVSTRECWVTEPEDRWAYADDWLPGEYECVLSVECPDGTVFRMQDIVELAAEVWRSCPAAFTRLCMTVAAEAMDQTGHAILN